MSFDQEMAALQAKYGVAPVAPVTVKTAPVKTAPVKGVASFTSPDGFVVETEKIDEVLFKALALRATTNDWYPVLEWLDTQPSCMLRIRRSENSAAKSPTTKIWAAITRSLKLRLASAGKFDCRAHATEKGVWFLIKRV